MTLRVLGSGAGGGFPQWNCNCVQCTAVRAGSPHHRARTQSSIAVGGPDDWLLVNASPDILTQLQRSPALQPARAVRDTGIAAVLLCDGQIDHSTGLYMLRERGTPLPLWTTRPAFEDLSQGNPILRVLSHYCGVDWNELPIDGTSFSVPGVAGLRLTAMPLDSKPAPYSPHRERPVPGDNIGLVFENLRTGGRVFYAPGLGEISPLVWETLGTVDAVMVDGTFWTDDEMIRLGFSKKTARDIGHLPQSGPGGMLDWLARLPASTRKLLIHINNTNPILDESSPERRAVEAAGVEVTFDGLELTF
ncbi:pyrroloquinoline quinone biosynthesis protein B [Sphaerotilus hippei]|uniref:Coenzyme PQQ synthesis protein B n=1 Tax=Sphaerotilus hippei TaxID=744406 RepID=A0A318H6Z9_9BURK|nr:pyrroloquinoline quinone biosynthesis protein PqqB [Sphaerotilus hippei]PXW99531.1 pyrroloquinoline quinone biosynthesis protein B [Sphaerotilus hippei]